MPRSTKGTQSRTSGSTRRRKSAQKSGPAPSAPSSESSGISTSTELDVLPFRPPAATRDPNTGQFLPGISGNPSGAPKGSQHRLTTLKRELEIAVRENLTPHQIAQVVHRMYELALMGSVGAAKLLLDKTISNARTEEEEAKGSGGIVIKIENLTVPGTEPEREIIDITPTNHEEQE